MTDKTMMIIKVASLAAMVVIGTIKVVEHKKYMAKEPETEEAAE